MSKHQQKKLADSIVTSKPFHGGRAGKLKLASGLIVVCAAVIAGVYGYKWYQQNKTVLTVGDYSYSQKDYDRLITEAAKSNVSETAARKAIIAGLASRAAADKLHIAYPTDENSVLLAVRAQFSNVSTATEYQKVVSYPKLVDIAVELRQKGGYDFVQLEFPFSRYIVGFFRKDFGDRNLIGNQAAIAKDIAYAKKQRDAYLAALNTKTKPVDQMIAEISTDKRLVNGQYGNQTGRISIDLKGNRLGLDAAYSVSDELLSQVKLAAKHTQQPYVGEEQFTVAPAEYGLGNMAEIQRGANTLVGWRILIVSNVYAQDPTLQVKYNQYQQEYQQHVED